MGANKFEEDIKGKLEGRRLIPSEDAWGKLSNQLDEQKETKNNKPFWWFTVAASIIGVLLVASQFLNNQTHVEDLPKVVESPEVIKQDSNTMIAKEALKDKTFEEKKVVKELNKSLLKESTKDAINNRGLENVIAISTKEKVDAIEKDVDVKSSDVLKENPSFEEQKIQDIVAQVHVLKDAKTEVTDADIDALLLQAQQEIRLYKILNKTTGLVDANALLQDVEQELDQSFRNKVFKAIKASFNTVKTAVAQRND